MDVLERLRALHCWSMSIGLGLSQEHMPRRLTPTLSLPESPSKRARGAASSDEEMIIDERDVPTEVIPSPSQTVVDPDPTEVIPSPSQTVVEPNPMEVSSRSPNLTVVAPDPTVSTQVSEMSPGPAVDPSPVVSALDHVEGAGRFLLNFCDPPQALVPEPVPRRFLPFNPDGPPPNATPRERLEWSIENLRYGHDRRQHMIRAIHDSVIVNFLDPNHEICTQAPDTEDPTPTEFSVTPSDEPPATPDDEPIPPDTDDGTSS